MLEARTAPPHNIEVEQALLGAILVDNSAIDRVVGIVQPEDFSEHLHAMIYETILAMRRDELVASPITLRQHVTTWPEISKGMPAWKYLGQLAIHATSIANVRSYAETVRDYSARRHLFDAGATLMESAANPMLSVSQTASVAVQSLDHVLSIARSKSRKPMTFIEAAEDLIDSITNDDGSDRITTGFSGLDAVTGGWRRKQLAILGGRPSMGKTTIANSAMLRTAKAGHGVLMFSLEMSSRDLMARCLTDLAWSPDRRIQYSEVLAGRLPDRDLRLIAETASQRRKLPLIVDEQPGLTLAEIGARTRAEAQKMERNGVKLGLVVVDHLGKVKPTARYAGSKVNEVGEISEGLAALAKEQNVAVLALHQLNRGTEAQENKRPSLANLRNSGDIEQDADLICFAYRESYYLERMKCDPGTQAEVQRQAALEACANTLELMVSKNRNGPTTTVTLYCDMGSNAVRDLG